MSELKQIVFEVEESVVVRSGELTVAGYCPSCEDNVAMATPCMAAALSDMSEREIFRLIEAGAIHFTETGQVMICLKSVHDLLEELRK